MAAAEVEEPEAYAVVAGAVEVGREPDTDGAPATGGRLADPYSARTFWSKVRRTPRTSGHEAVPEKLPH